MPWPGDDYVRLWYVNAIWKLSRHFHVPADRRELAQSLALDTWRELVDSPTSIEPRHAKMIRPHVEALGASTPGEYVANYASNNLRLAETQDRVLPDIDELVREQNEGCLAGLFRSLFGKRTR